MYSQYICIVCICICVVYLHLCIWVKYLWVFTVHLTTLAEFCILNWIQTFCSFAQGQRQTIKKKYISKMNEIYIGFKCIYKFVYLFWWTCIFHYNVLRVHLVPFHQVSTVRTIFYLYVINGFVDLNWANQCIICIAYMLHMKWELEGL